MAAMLRSRWARWSFEILLALAVLWAVRAYMLRTVVSGQAPPIAGMLVDGRALALKQLRGRPVLVHFWASWCGICRAEQDSIADLARQHAVVTIAMQSGDRRAVRAYLQRHQLRMPVLADPNGSLARRYGVRAVPTSFVLDRHGVIRFTTVGYTTEIGLRLRLWLAGFW